MMSDKPLIIYTRHEWRINNSLFWHDMNSRWRIIYFMSLLFYMIIKLYKNHIIFFL